MVHRISRNDAAAPGATSEAAITNSAIHKRDIIPWLLDSPITEVSWQAGKSPRHAATGLQDPAFMTLRTANGTLATLELYLNTQYGYTTAAKSFLNAAPLPCRIRHGSAPCNRGRGRRRYQQTGAPGSPLQARISALGEGEQPSLARAQDGLNASLMAQAMIQSLHSNGAYTKAGYA